MTFEQSLAPPWRSPRMGGVLTVLVCVGCGVLVLLALITDIVSPHWSRTALAVQGLALILALVWTPWLPARRVLVHPVLLATTVYLWDTTLPPPTLPAGLARAVVPPAMAALIAGDIVYCIWRLRRWQRSRLSVPVRAGYVELSQVASMLEWSPPALRQQLIQSGRLIVVSADGRELVSLTDVLDVSAGRTHAGATAETPES